MPIASKMKYLNQAKMEESDQDSWGKYAGAVAKPKCKNMYFAVTLFLKEDSVSCTKECWQNLESILNTVNDKDYSSMCNKRVLLSIKLGDFFWLSDKWCLKVAGHAI